MTTIQTHSEISLAELLNGVKRLDTVALESFADEVLAIRAQRRAPRLLQLIDQIEAHDVERVKNLGKLAQLRNVPVRTLLKQLSIRLGTDKHE